LADNDHTAHNMATIPACCAVLATPELLELIILPLSMSEIFTKAQRVSRTWKDIIAQSPTIQRKLRLRPEVDRVTSPITFLPDRIWSFAVRHRPSTGFERTLPVYPVAIDSNRLAYCYFLRACWLRYHHKSRTIFNTIRFSKRHLAQVSGPFRPTWLGMFVTEPRITIARLELELQSKHDAGKTKRAQYYLWSSASVRDDGGLTFGAVLDAGEKMRQSAPVDTEGRENARVLVQFVSEP